MDRKEDQLSDNVVPECTLNRDCLHQIMLHLTVKDICRCMQVCRFWMEVLSDEYLWKKFISQHFDLELKTDVEEEGTYGQWSVPDNWYCYYTYHNDGYVMRPFPTMWKCGVIHPSGLDPLTGDVKSLQGFSRSLEILTHMKKGIDSLDLASGRGCSANEGENGISVVLFPWGEEQLPSKEKLVKDIFHFHPTVAKDAYEEVRSDEKLYYHLPKDDEDDDDDDHDIREKPCLNRIFGFGYDYDDSKTAEKVDDFYSWLQNIMVPCMTVFAGDDKFNPVAVFCLTKLAPGWVGGALTGVTYT